MPCKNCNTENSHPIETEFSYGRRAWTYWFLVPKGTVSMNILLDNIEKDISEIKEYLKKHNLIKIGTSAPENILRQIYESAYLSGNIINKNPNILLHNWETNDYYIYKIT